MRLVADDALAIITIWQEARGEPYSGKVAVGEVIRNRMKQLRRPRTVAEVVLEPRQFSGWNSGDVNRIKSVLVDDQDPEVIECRRAWQESETAGTTDGATLYFNPKLAQPYWASLAIFTTTIGNHRFYREP